MQSFVVIDLRGTALELKIWMSPSLNPMHMFSSTLMISAAVPSKVIMDLVEPLQK